MVSQHVLLLHPPFFPYLRVSSTGQCRCSLGPMCSPASGGLDVGREWQAKRYLDSGKIVIKPPMLVNTHLLYPAFMVPSVGKTMS